ncbi:MFS general substrate transporter [Xylariomycetidae sp. FL0641]|nr:MFS general substrate transporter [Xylariomycetidae sp. FL0641]
MAETAEPARRGLAFWAIIIGLGITLLLSALEHSVLVTAAPIVLADIPLGDDWVWLTNAFFLSSAAIQPLLGQLCNVFGRRWVTLGSITTFMLGSGLCGGARNGAMLIAGRAIQGAGSGGIVMVFDVVVSDLVPLRERGKYIAVIMLIYSMGTILGPFIGGSIVETGDWRWIFYINLPVGAVSFAVLFVYLRVNAHRETIVASLGRIDFVGNITLIASSTAVLLAISYAGTRYAWSSWHTLLPLILGFIGFLLFAAFQASRLAPPDSVIPRRLFANRTSVIVAINSFLNWMLAYWSVLFLPVYFQAVHLASPQRAGVCLIPLSLFGIPAAAAGAAVLARTGRYKLIHVCGFALFTVGRGLYTLLDEKTPTAEWVAYQLLAGVGAGVLLNTLLPAFQAPLRENDQAVGTATFNFVRTLGSVWGIAIPAAIFQNYVDMRVSQGALVDAKASSLLVNGGAYQYASAKFVKQFEKTTQDQIRNLYRQAIQHIFFVSFAFMGLALLLSLFEKDHPLRKTLDTEFGLVEKEKQDRNPGIMHDTSTQQPTTQSRNENVL